MPVLPKISWPVPSGSNGSDFARQDEVMAHLEGEATGMYLLGRNGMWHGGIHITNATTPWCALSGQAPAEAADFPVRYRGEQAVRCMADGEVVAYRICRDYLQVPWECGPLSVSGSFVLVRHCIQPGEKAESGLHFYTLYMHLAPWSAYDTDSGARPWTVCNSLSAYAPEWLLGAGADSQSVNDAYRVATMPAGTRVAWDDSDTSLSITSRGRRYGLVTFRGLSAEESQGNTRLQPGQQYWVLVDHDNLAPAAGEATRPAWWAPLLPPFRQTLQFDRVVCPDPYPVKAGDAVGHLGYFQTPKEGGYDARYQVHIECLSMDANLETFLTNPERVGEDTPVWLKCPAGLALYEKNVMTGGFSRKSRVSDGEAILALSQVNTEQDAQKQSWYYLPFAHGYVPVDSQDVETLSQYDLDRLGFKAITDEATTFDHLDGKTPPAGLVRRIFETLLAAAKADPRVSHRSVPFNYQRLLNKIDRGVTPYSSQEYLSAVHNPSYREARSRLVVKHPSEWYHRKGDALWQGFLNSLLPDAPEWREYSEGFIDRMAWMQDAGRLKLGPLLWHMHPVELLGSFYYENTIEIAWGAKVPKEFKLKVIKVCERLEIEPDYLMSCMAFETGDSFSPAVRNPSGSATGLIQFMSTTAQILGTTTSELAAMSAVEQMDYVEKYFKPYAGRLHTIDDVYMVIFCPKAVGKPEDYVLYDEGRSYRDNIGLDINRDDKITKFEAGLKVRSKLNLGRSKGYRG